MKNFFTLVVLGGFLAASSADAMQAPRGVAQLEGDELNFFYAQFDNCLHPNFHPRFRTRQEWHVWTEISHEDKLAIFGVAIRFNQPVLLSAVIADGAYDLNDTYGYYLDREKFSPLPYAASCSRDSIVRLLLWCAHPSRQPQTPEVLGKALCMSVLRGRHIDIIQCLLELGAPVNFVDEKGAWSYVEGCTALHYAAREGRVEAIKLLLAQADVLVNVQNKAGETPLDLAVDAMVAAKAIFKNPIVPESIRAVQGEKVISLGTVIELLERAGAVLGETIQPAPAQAEPVAE